MLQPQLLTDGQQVPIVKIGSAWCRECAANSQGGFLIGTDRLLKGIALDILDYGPMEIDERFDPSGRPGSSHAVVHLPVLVAHRGGRRTRVIEEVVPCRRFGLAFEIGKLVDAVELGLDDPGISTFLDLLAQIVALGPAGDFNKCRQPVEGREQLVLDRARLDVSRPADD